MSKGTRFPSSRTLPVLFLLGVAVCAVAQLGPVYAQEPDPPPVPDSLQFKPYDPQPRGPTSSPTLSTTDGKGAFDDIDFDSVFDDLDMGNDFEVREDLSFAINYGPIVHFNRVDAWALGLRFGFDPGSGWFPSFDARLVYAIGRERWLYILGGKQPILSERLLLVGLEYRRYTDDFDHGIVSRGENFASAFGFKYDYQDHFERGGTSFYAETTPLPWLYGKLGYVSHDFTSITQIAPGSWTIFNNSRAWRENPAVDDGRLQAISLRVEFDKRDNVDTPKKGWWLRFDFESSSKGLGSDFSYTRHGTELRGYYPLPRDMALKGRLIVGTTVSGTLPFQKDYTVGGISTMPAITYKTSRGDHMLLGNVQYLAELWGGRKKAGIKTDIKGIVFLDFGQAWDGDSYNLRGQRMFVDAGIGAGIADNRLQIFFAQDLQNSRFDPLMQVRISSPY